MAITAKVILPDRNRPIIAEHIKKAIINALKPMAIISTHNINPKTTANLPILLFLLNVRAKIQHSYLET